MSVVRVKQVVIPAAGLGTRFLPITKSIPKEMLPIGNKPAIHYVVQEGVDAGVTDFCIVSHRKKVTLEHYFSCDENLEHSLEERDKGSWLREVKELREKARVSFVYQDEPLGLGHAIGLAQKCITDTHFGVMLPDDLVGDASQPVLIQLMYAAVKAPCAVVPLARVSDDKVSSYGVVKTGEQLSNGSWAIDDIVEKPVQSDAPSNLAVLGRYILPRDVFPILSDLSPSGGEIQLTDGLRALIKQGIPVYGVEIQGTWLGTGNPADWLETNRFFSRMLSS